MRRIWFWLTCDTICEWCSRRDRAWIPWPGVRLTRHWRAPRVRYGICRKCAERLLN